MAYRRTWRRWRRRVRQYEPGARRRPSVWWVMLWVIVVIILLGLLFGGYRKGTKSAPAPEWRAVHVVAAAVYR